MNEQQTKRIQYLSINAMFAAAKRARLLNYAYIYFQLKDVQWAGPQESHSTTWIYSNDGTKHQTDKTLCLMPPLTGKSTADILQDLYQWTSGDWDEEIYGNSIFPHNISLED